MLERLFNDDNISKTQHSYMKGKSVETTLHKVMGCMLNYTSRRMQYKPLFNELGQMGNVARKDIPGHETARQALKLHISWKEEVLIYFNLILTLRELIP